MKVIAAALLSIALLGCDDVGGGNGISADGLQAKVMADNFDQQCRAMPADNEAATQRDQLCSCASDYIRSHVRNGDDSDVTERIFDEARDECLRKVSENG